ncbi:hypothetical protein F0U59_48690 [Archangium gephyra]|nr:hypothetical protein F0U59_48690 [Archangium gephyra]
MGEGPWLLQVRQSDLWVRPLSGEEGYALTRTGRVAASVRPGRELGWNGVAISPDGRQVAYVETAGTPGRNAVGGWSLLWVVNADGSGRRLLVDLRQGPNARGRVRAGPLLWSSDGARVAYVLESFPDEAVPGQPPCPLATVRAVEVTTGGEALLLESPGPGMLQPRGWSVKRGEFSFSLQCAVASEGPSDTGRFVTHRLGEGARSLAGRGSVSPDGSHLLLLPSASNAGSEPVLLDGMKVETPVDFHSSLVRHVTWMRGQPVAYLTTYPGFSGACGFEMSPPPALYGVDPRGSQPGMRKRTGRSGLMVFAFSPDDAHVLVAVVQRHPQGRDGCTTNAFDALLAVERSLFEGSSGLDALVGASVRLDEPAEPLGRALQGYVGWLR